MLKLVKRHIRGPSGVKCWRMILPGRQIHDLFLAWDDLILRDPVFEWPEFCNPEAVKGWERGIRVVWHEPLGRYFYQVDAPVPDFASVTIGWPGFGSKGKLNTVSRWSTSVLSKGVLVGVIPLSMRLRIERACGRKLGRWQRCRYLLIAGAPVVVFGTQDKAYAIALLAPVDNA